MAHALIGVTKKYGNLVMCYVDDVLIATATVEDHIERLDEVFACMKKLCEAPVLGMPTQKRMYVLDTDASLVAISGILHQEQEWNGKTVLRPIAYGTGVKS